MPGRPGRFGPSPRRIAEARSAPALAAVSNVRYGRLQSTRIPTARPRAPTAVEVLSVIASVSNRSRECATSSPSLPGLTRQSIALPKLFCLMDARIPSPPRLRRATSSLGRRSFSEGGKSGHDELSRKDTPVPYLSAPAAFYARGFAISLALYREGAGNAGGSNAPAASRAKGKSTRVSPPQVRRTIRHSLREWF